MHIGRSDPHDAIPLLSPLVTYSVVGHNPLAGQFAGPEEVAGHLTDLFVTTLGTFDTIKWEDWLEGDFFTAVVADVHLQVARGKLASRELFLLEFDSSNLIKHIAIHTDSPDAMDRLLTRPDAPGRS